MTAVSKIENKSQTEDAVELNSAPLNRHENGEGENEVVLASGHPLQDEADAAELDIQGEENDEEPNEDEYF